jgi:hypothetical protein
VSTPTTSGCDPGGHRDRGGRCRRSRSAVRARRDGVPAAEKSSDRSYFLATVVYSYAFLFPASPADRPNAFDPRLRTAADLYNRALTRGLTAEDGKNVDLRAGDYALPFGTLSISFDRDALHWAGRDLSGFVPATDLHITGLQNRYREAGLGAPLAADLDPTGDQLGFRSPGRSRFP